MLGFSLSLFASTSVLGAVTLSGSSTGNCAVDGNCFSSLDYTNYEV